jgi:hypothetical protein
MVYYWVYIILCKGRQYNQYNHNIDMGCTGTYTVLVHVQCTCTVGSKEMQFAIVCAVEATTEYTE